MALSIIIIPILHRRKLRLRKVRKHPQDHEGDINESLPNSHTWRTALNEHTAQLHQLTFLSGAGELDTTVEGGYPFFIQHVADTHLLSQITAHSEKELGNGWKMLWYKWCYSKKYKEVEKCEKEKADFTNMQNDVS